MLLTLTDLCDKERSARWKVACDYRKNRFYATVVVRSAIGFNSESQCMYNLELHADTVAPVAHTALGVPGLCATDGLLALGTRLFKRLRGAEAISRCRSF